MTAPDLPLAAIETPGASLYILVFAASAVVCLASLPKTREIENPGVRRGAASLLLLSAGWAASHVGYLAASSPLVQEVFYQLGLIMGFAAVGAWLYFCSAYTGRSLHLHRTVRWTAAFVYIAVVAVKLTNPLHHLYYTAESVTEPFPYLVIHHEPLHWVAMGLAYSLAFIGFFVLFESFSRVSYDTGPLVAVVGLSGLPVVFDVIGATTPYLLELTYSPVGVAAFSVGFFHVYFHRFRAIRLTGASDDAVVVVDDAGRVRDSNSAARELFPELAGVVDQPLESLLPEVHERARSPRSVLPLEREGEVRYYNVTRNPFTAGDAGLGAMLTLSDVTERERYRRELERKNEQLDEFASVVSHDLRNPINVASGRLELAMEECDSEHLKPVERAVARMETLVEDLLTLAREGDRVSEVELVDLGSVVTECWSNVAASEAILEVESSVELQADESRLRQLFENLLRNAVEHGGEDVTVTVGRLEDGFYVEDDGVGIPEAEQEKVFEHGYTSTEHGTGFGLGIVRKIAEAHGWTVRARESDDGGARFEFTDVDVAS